jgi:hypothetical protein
VAPEVGKIVALDILGEEKGLSIMSSISDVTLNDV